VLPSILFTKNQLFMSASNYFTDKEVKEIKDAIRQAENTTSGEIRLHLDKHCKEDVLDHAAFLFEKLEMHKTELRNGVLFYLAYEDHKFAILGDAGINKVVPDHFWDDIKDEMAAHFKKGEFSKGLSVGIERAGEQLKKHFPVQKDDINELSDDISYGS